MLLDVLSDERNGGYCEWKLAAQESSTEIFSDSPCKGPPTAIHTSKVMSRQGLAGVLVFPAILVRWSALRAWEQGWALRSLVRVFLR